MDAPDVAAPQLPELESIELPDAGELGGLDLADALVEAAGATTATRIHVQESEVHGLSLPEGTATEFFLRDARLVELDATNGSARGAELRRVELANPRLVGFGITEGEIDDLRVSGGTMMLGSIAGSAIRHAVFEGVNLREASFADTRLTDVAFERCDLAGADFRGVRIEGCAIRGSSLEGVQGIDSLRGLTMPWDDLVGSAGALAGALGIAIERDQG
jgi:uncharacterized protein YjbI with pentapeptide repeats